MSSTMIPPIPIAALANVSGGDNRTSGLNFDQRPSDVLEQFRNRVAACKVLESEAERLGNLSHLAWDAQAARNAVSDCKASLGLTR
jgi:hypothetical protein